MLIFKSIFIGKPWDYKRKPVYEGPPHKFRRNTQRTSSPDVTYAHVRRQHVASARIGTVYDPVQRG